MAYTKVSALTAKTTPAGTEELLINDGGVSKKITQTNLLSTALPKAGGTMTGDTLHGDNVKAKFGASDDLQIWHNSTGGYSIIRDAGAGDLYIEGSANIRLRDPDGRQSATFVPNGSQTFYNANSVKLATTSTGIDVTGSVTCDGFTVEGSDGGIANFINKDTIVTAGEDIGTINFTATSDSNLTSEKTLGSLQVTAESAITSNSPHGAFTISTMRSGVLEERVRFPSTGGITFNGDTAAANALDDYETGNGVATITMSGSGSVTASSTDKYYYTKVGNLVTFGFEFKHTAVSSPVGTLQVGLPFTSAGSYYSAGSARTYSETFTGSPFLSISPNNTVLQFATNISGSATGNVTPTAGTHYYFGSISYRTT